MTYTAATKYLIEMKQICANISQFNSIRNIPLVRNDTGMKPETRGQSHIRRFSYLVISLIA